MQTDGYKTEILSENIDDIERAASLLSAGEVVAIPTETVYGLAADALDPDAVSGIFRAKGRPSDNPLIVHIADISELESIAHDIPPAAYLLAERFWPGPLTMVLPKNDCIPSVTSGGLDTVGVRMPAHRTARAIIKAAGRPLAAPSANLSGSPSPTSARHVLDDMNGRIPAIVDGGVCGVGVESTVVSFEGNNVRLLRPGFVSPEEIEEVCGGVIVDSGVLERVDENKKVASPGMKYKHYSPKAEIILINGALDRFIPFVTEHMADGVYAMVFDGDVKVCSFPCISYGDTAEEQARQVFDRLRELDRLGAKTAYVRCPERTGVGLAVYNRLLRAAGFRVVNL